MPNDSFLLTLVLGATVDEFSQMEESFLRAIADSAGVPRSYVSISAISSASLSVSTRILYPDPSAFGSDVRAFFRSKSAADMQAILSARSLVVHVASEPVVIDLNSPPPSASPSAATSGGKDNGVDDDGGSGSTDAGGGDDASAPNRSSAQTYVMPVVVAVLGTCACAIALAVHLRGRALARMVAIAGYAPSSLPSRSMRAWHAPKRELVSVTASRARAPLDWEEGARWEGELGVRAQSADRTW